MLVGAGLEAKLAAGVADTLGPDAARRLRDDPWALLSLQRRLARGRRPAGHRRPQRRRPAGQPPRPGDRRPHPADGDPRRAHRAARRPGRRRPAAPRASATRRRRSSPPSSPATCWSTSRPSRRIRTPSRIRRCGRCRSPATAWPRSWWPRRSPGWPPPAERIADPASVRTVAKGLDKAQQAAGRPGAGRRRQPADRRPGHRQEPHGGRRRQAAAGQGHRHRAGRAHRPGGQAARGAHRPPRVDGAPAARRPGHDRRVRPQRGVAAGRRRRSSSTRPRCSTSS